MTTARYIVRSGPSAGRIWDSAKYTFDKTGARVPVWFTLGNGSSRIKADFIVLGVSQTDGDGQELMITGHIHILTDQPVRMYYVADRADGNKGFIEFAQ